MGDTGPCGPCSEIHIDLGKEVGCDRPDCAVGCDCDRFLELWNLVFMQFYRDENGTMTRLPKPSIDTGMGLERVAAVLQGKFNNFDSDLFTPIIEHICALAKKEYGLDKNINASMRVIADHARATTFLVADGVLPSNEGRGYVLRRIMRRAIRFGRTIGLKGLFFGTVCDKVLDNMEEAYPHLSSSRELLNKVTHNEETRFGETLDHGLAMLGEKISLLKREQGDDALIDGEFIFKLYDTFGFPVDIVRDIAIEKHVSFDEAGFEAAMAKQREQSRRSWKGVDVDHLSSGITQLLEKGKSSAFVGYTTKAVDTTVDAIINTEGLLSADCSQGERVQVLCSQTPFYAESGGQVGDIGTISWENGQMQVESTTEPVKGLILHEGLIQEGVLKQGVSVNLSVADAVRDATALNHTATHLLHAAMKEVLGDHVKQAGSLVEEERLRFDFTHFSPVSTGEIVAIENIVNNEIRKNIDVMSAVLDRETAISDGATALFGEKYDDEVRVVSIGAFSKELCGGTHTSATGDIGFLKIVSETGIASGVRRIEAVTGKRAVSWAQNLVSQAGEISDILSGPLGSAGDKIKTLMKRQKELEQEVARLTAKIALSDLDDLLSGGTDVNGIKVIACEVMLDSPKTLREIGDKIRDKMKSGIAVIGGNLNGKAALLSLVSKDLTNTVKAGALISEVAKIVGGKGGGRPDMAQAGGPMADKLSEAIGKVPEIVQGLMGK